jgi:hypothetical protein
MSLLLPQRHSTERPAQGRSFDAQAAELGLDPMSRSPMEAKLGYALLRLLLDPNEFGPPNYINLFLPYGAINGADEMPPIDLIEPGVINVAPGCWVNCYQSDFLLDVKAPRSPVVARGTLECDGHDYHDKTTEQASHDRKRDREFQKTGVAVLRFTGTDIFENPEACAREAIQVLLRQSLSRAAL